MYQVLISGGRLADPARVIPAELERALTEAVMLLEREVKRRTPIGVTEAARGSIAGEVRPAGLTVGMVGNVVGVVGSPLKHVAVVNDGRRPGQKMPPPQALELWVRRKIKKVGPRGGRSNLSVREARGLAFVIARAIAERGTEPVRMFEAALEENEAAVRTIFEQAGYRIELQLIQGGGA